MPPRKLQAHLEVKTESGAVLGGARIRLLEAIDKYGSIAQAARRIPMSYKAAWDALDDLNNLADLPVIERSIGGSGGGGTKLTDYGRKLIAMFHAIEGEYQAAMDHLYGEIARAGRADKLAFQRLLRRVALRSSARNQFACAVSRIEEGTVNAQVFLTLDADCELEAQITTDSVKRLELAAGQEVVALVKASSVFLLSDSETRTSASNHLSGFVSRIHKGPVNAEVVVDIPLRRTRHITAVVTTQSLRALGLEVGSAATAAFQASSVILATFG